MRCREALLAFIRSVSNTNMVPAGEVKPQTSNFMEWSKLVANAIAPGSHNEYIRGYLKAVAKETWQLAGWLTHAVNASRHDGTIVVDVAHSVIEAFGAALIGVTTPKVKNRTFRFVAETDRLWRANRNTFMQSEIRSFSASGASLQ
jgi:hypothetical protein